jgi:cytochrome P450
MAYTTNTCLAGLLLLALCIFYHHQKRNAVARAHGCGTLTRHRPKEPLFGFDFQMSMHMDIPFVYRQHQRYGSTFQVNALLSQPSIITVAPENIHAVNTGKDWGVEPQRLAGMEGFCGRGFLTTDGDAWHRSRRLMKSTFARANSIDMSALSREVDRFLCKLPKDGSTMDLQPLFYTMVCFSKL